jgi:hypothetical protein
VADDLADHDTDAAIGPSERVVPSAADLQHGVVGVVVGGDRDENGMSKSVVVHRPIPARPTCNAKRGDAQQHAAIVASLWLHCGGSVAFQVPEPRIGETFLLRNPL